MPETLKTTEDLRAAWRGTKAELELLDTRVEGQLARRLELEARLSDIRDEYKVVARREWEESLIQPERLLDLLLAGYENMRHFENFPPLDDNEISGVYDVDGEQVLCISLRNGQRFEVRARAEKPWKERP